MDWVQTQTAAAVANLAPVYDTSRKQFLLVSRPVNVQQCCTDLPTFDSEPVPDRVRDPGPGPTLPDLHCMRK